MSTMQTIHTPSLDDLDDLRQRIDGTLVAPDDADRDRVRQAWNVASVSEARACDAVRAGRVEVRRSRVCEDRGPAWRQCEDRVGDEQTRERLAAKSRVHVHVMQEQHPARGLPGPTGS